MSEREQLQQRITAWLTARRDTFSAPYGVLDSVRKLRRGAVRTITFGRARTLDANLTIWSPTNMTLQTNRGNFTVLSEVELYQLLCDKFGASP